MAVIFHILRDGGIIFSYPIVLLFFVVLYLIIKGFLSKSDINKTKELLISIGWFVLAWGFLGRTVGLINAFDNIQASGELTPKLLSGGIKMALVDPLLGIFTFCVARAGVIIFMIKNNEVSINN
jgi:hypothetical protein